VSPQVPTGWRIVRRYKHDKTSFTQGLAWREAPAQGTGTPPQEQGQQNILYESRGMWDRSGVRKMTLSPPLTAGGGSAERGDYAILKDVPIEGHGDMFGEGLTLWPGSAPAAPANDSAGDSSSGSSAEAGVLVQLTWMNRRAFLYDPGDLRALGSFEYATTVTRERNNEGWGITHDGTHLIVSDGTNNVIFWRLRWDPANPRASGYEEVRRIAVRDASRNVGVTSSVVPPKGVGQDIPLLNELEYAHGWLLSNIWFDNRIAIIDPGSGAAVAYLDLTPLREEQRNSDADVLNGIAYTMTLGPTSPAVDGVGAAPWGGRLWVTGKQWETLYELVLTELQTPNLALLRRERQLSRKGRGGKAAGGDTRQGSKSGAT
jgi:glutamine cyclotransferase